MPSSFSPSLRLELIAPGEQAGTWGSTTNTNLGTLVEDAIAGYETVSVLSANQELTYADGAADQARNAVLQLTTTTAAAFSIYAPPYSKQYTIFNSSAHDATIYNSSSPGNTTAAGTGVTIPAGRTMTVWSDGTNFRVQNNNLIGNLVGNVTGNVAGQLDGTITSGTTGVTQPFGTNNTTLSTTAFVQAALQALHPIGSIYINATNSANPSTYFGFGTWVAFGAGRVPVGFNAADPLFDTAEETGGSKDAIVVSHTHTVTSSGTTGGQSAGHTHTFSGTTGGQSQTHSHAISISDPGHAHGLGPQITGGGGATARISAATQNDGQPASTAGAGTGITATAGNASQDHNHDYSGTTSGVSSDHTHNVTVSGTTASAGSSGTNANLQPYITVFMWKRTA
jgi:hypothetical protein